MLSEQFETEWKKFNEKYGSGLGRRKTMARLFYLQGILDAWIESNNRLKNR